MLKIKKECMCELQKMGFENAELDFNFTQYCIDDEWHEESVHKCWQKHGVYVSRADRGIYLTDVTENCCTGDFVDVIMVIPDLLKEFFERGMIEN